MIIFDVLKHIIFSSFVLDIQKNILSPRMGKQYQNLQNRLPDTKELPV